MLSFMVAGTVSAGTDFSSMSIAELATNVKYDLDFSDKILFQKASTYVESFSKKLCTDGTFIYGGTRTLKVCLNESDSGQCTQYVTKTVELIQPIVSERQRCAQTSNDDDYCVKKETVVFVQSPNRKIKVLDATTGSDDRNPTVVGVKNYTIPNCGSLKPVPAN
jgi:hypothetical protein